MRLWHKDLIPVLPGAQLVAQWRELSAIAGKILTDGTPNHILVNKVINFPMDDFITYAQLVRNEMTKRGYRTMDRVWNKIVSVDEHWDKVSYDLLYDSWMNNTYLTICYYNLYEKFICHGIERQEWNKIEELYQNKIKGK